MYKLIRPLIFTLDPELAHELGLVFLKIRGKINVLGNTPQRPTQVMGLNFPNPIGLAAGLDKNGDAIDGLGMQGFGFLELGTVTPKPQPGNPKPRLFRLVEAEGIINRMGFNNKGIDYLIAKVNAKKYFNGIIGINIGKNITTPVEEADKDYLTCLDKAYSFADYIAVNLSSPNTPGLRTLQFGDTLKHLLHQLKERQHALHQQHKRYVPLAIKIAPDMTEEETRLVAETLKAMAIDGVIATNTTISRQGVDHLKHGTETGGLSGAPLFTASTHTIKLLADALGGSLPIIASGGVMSAEQAVAKLQAGASLVQLYSGFIYKGKALVHDSINALSKQLSLS